MRSIGRDAVLMAPLSESSLGSYPVGCHRPEISVHCERIDPSSAARLGIERKMKSSGLRPMKRFPRAPRGQPASATTFVKRAESVRSRATQKACSQGSWENRRKRSGPDPAFLWVSNIELRFQKKLTDLIGDFFEKRDACHVFLCCFRGAG